MASTDGNIRVHLSLIDKGFAKAIGKDVAALNALEASAMRNNKLMRMQNDLLTNELTKAFGRLGARVSDFGARLVKLNLKGFTLELGAVTAGLLLMKASLATGRFIANAWGKTVDFLRGSVAGLTAGVTALVATLAAANREFTTLQMMPFAGGSMVNAGVPLRMANPAVQMMGVQGNTQVIASLRKAGLTTHQIQGLMPQLANLSNADPKAYTQLAQALGQSTSAGSSRAFAEALGGQGSIFKGVSKQAASMSADTLIGAIISGQLTPKAFEGQISRLNETLFGSFKGMVTRLYTSLADMGWMFIGPLRDAMFTIEREFAVTLSKIYGSMRNFGDTMGGGIGDQATSFFSWMAQIINNDLPKLPDKFRAIGSWWKDFTAGGSRWFGSMGDRMHKYEDSAASAWEMTKNIGRPVWGEVKNTFRAWNTAISQNGPGIEGFGTALGGALAGGLEMVTRGITAFIDNLPAIRKFFNFLKDEVFPKLGDFAESFMDAFAKALPFIQSMVSALMPLLAVLTSIVGTIGGMGGLGGAIVTAGYMAGMTRGGRAAMGGFYYGRKHGPQGALFQSHMNRSPIATAFGAKYYSGGGMMAIPMNETTGLRFSKHGPGSPLAGRVFQAAGTGTGAGQLVPVKGNYKVGHGGWNGISGGHLAMYAMMAGGMAGMIGGDNQVTSMMQQMSMAAPLMMAGERVIKGVPISGMKMAGGAAAIMGLIAASKTRGTGTGVGAGLLAGLPAAMALGATPAGLAALIGGGIWGGVSGWKNQRKYERLGVEFANKSKRNFVTDMGNLSTRQGIRDALESYELLLRDTDQLRINAEQQGVSYKSYRDQMYRNKSGIGLEGAGMLTRLESALTSIADITGEAALDIEAQAERYGLALHKTADLVEFYHRRNERYKTYGAPEYRTSLTGILSSRIANSVFAVGTPQQQRLQAAQNTMAANTALGNVMQAGGFDDALAQDVLVTTMAEGQALGLKGAELLGWFGLSMQGWGEMMRGRGYNISDSRIQKLTRVGMAAANPNNLLPEFLKTAEGQSMFEMMTGTGLYTKGQSHELMKKALMSNDPEKALEGLTKAMHSEQAKKTAVALGEVESASLKLAYAFDLLLDSSLTEEQKQSMGEALGLSDQHASERAVLKDFRPAQGDTKVERTAKAMKAITTAGLDGFALWDPYGGGSN